MPYKKELFVVQVDNYFPELCEITTPSLKTYANKIDANTTFHSSAEDAAEKYHNKAK